MTRKQALNYLESTGMSEEQIHEIVEAIERSQESEKRYTRLFDALKFKWIVTCEHDEQLTDKIERCEAALTTLKNLGFNLINGEVEND